MVDQPGRHLPHAFDAEMISVREQLAAMAGRCRQQLHLALDAFWTGSKEKTADVEASDAAVDRDEKSVDALVLRILALRQPVASDLRMLTACFKLVTDLERIGDEAVDIARTTVSSTPDGEPARERLRSMADATEELVGSATQAFLGRDGPAAERAGHGGEAVEALYREILQVSVDFMSRHPTEVVSTMSDITVAKCLERIAEHAVNIAEGTLFVVRGEPMPR
ncbi:MAG TPA: phosphate signaling complex protein PhoU [Polyangiaceae bacterium]|nr:phosphate signaling complex protein PhoU [Polyangiaceae bacterium]